MDDEFFSDDARMMAEMIQDQWSLGPGKEVNVAYEPEAYMTDARYGQIYVYLVSRNNSISTTDYRTLHRTARVSFRISNRFRDVHMEWCNEVYRILLANRRLGVWGLGGYTYYEILGDRTANDQQGWYTTTIDINLIGHCFPICSSGLGPDRELPWEVHK